jgi:hypothetical protein
MSDYEELANLSWDDVPEIKLLPTGTWKLRGQSATLQPAKSEGGSPSVLFTYVPVEPMADVDDDELAELHNGGEYDYSLNRIFVRMWISDGRDRFTVKNHVNM